MVIRKLLLRFVQSSTETFLCPAQDTLSFHPLSYKRVSQSNEEKSSIERLILRSTQWLANYQSPD
jgi:hypothetical protein